MPWVLEVDLPKAEVAATEKCSAEAGQQSPLKNSGVAIETQTPLGEPTATGSSPRASSEKRRFSDVEDGGGQAMRTEIEEQV